MAKPLNPRDGKNLIRAPLVQGGDGVTSMVRKSLWVEAGGVNTLARGLAVKDNEAAKIRNFQVSDDKRFESRRGTDIMGQEALDTVLQVVDFVRANGKKVTIRFTPSALELYDFGFQFWQSIPLPFHGNDKDFFCWTGWADKLLFSNGIDGLWEFDFVTRIAKQIPGAPSCKQLTTFGNRVVASAAEGLGYRIQWSKDRDYLVWDINIADGGGYEDLFSTPGGIVDEVMGVYPFTDEAAWVARSGSIWQMSVSGNPLAPFRFSRIISQLGCSNRNGIVQTPSGLIFPSQRSFFSITPQGTQEIGQLIKQEFYLGNSNDVLGTLAAYATYDSHRSEYRIALREFVYRYRTDFGTWTVDRYPWYIRSLSREQEGKTSISIDQLSGTIDALSGSIDELGAGYFSFAMMFALTGTGIVMREGNTPDDALVDGSRFPAETIIESGLIDLDPLLAVEILELQMQYETTTTQDVTYEFTQDDGGSWAPLSQKSLTPTAGPEIVLAKVARVSSKFRIRYHSFGLGDIKILGLFPSLVVVNRTMARKKQTPHDITVFPSSLQMNVGDQRQLTAVVHDITGGIIANAAVSWSSSDVLKATVNSKGLVAAVAAGDVIITVRFAGVATQVSVNVASVAAVPVATIEVTPSPATGVVGSLVQFTAVLKDASGNVLTGRVVVWGVTGGLATINSSGLALLNVSGGDTINVSSEGVVATVDLTITASAPAPASVSITPTLGAITVGQTKQLTATVFDGVGNQMPSAVVMWTSSDDTKATVSATGLVTGVSVGSVTITATSGFVFGTSAGTVAVAVVLVASVTLTPSSANITLGQSQNFTATPKDSSGNTLVGRVATWSSSDSSLATVDSSGHVSSLAVGAATITVDVEGVTASATVTIAQVAVATVSILPLSQTVSPGQSQQMTAVVKDAANNVLLGRAINWASTNSAVAPISPSGIVSAIAPGLATIFATVDGVTSNAASVSVVSAGVITYRSPYYAQPVGVTFDNSDASFHGEVVPMPPVPARVLNGGAAHVHWVGNAGDAPGGSTIYANSMAGYGVAAIAAVRGEVIVCQSFNVHNAAISQGAISTINHPGKGAATGATNDYIYVISSAVYAGTFPRVERERVGFDGADAGHMACFSFDYTGSSYDLSAFLQFASAADCSYWRFVGIEVRTTRPEPGAVLGRVYVNDLIRIGSTVTTLQTQVPHHLFFDRCWIHGSWDTTSLKNCINLNGDDIGIYGSEIGEAYNYGQESHAIGGLNANGRWHIENTVLRDASSLFLIGGAAVTLGSPYYPQDIWLKDCLFYRDPASKGGHARVQQVKNFVETKYGGRLLVTGFVMDGLWEAGQFCAFKIKTTVQLGQAYTWVQSHDITIAHGIIRNCPEPWDIWGKTESAVLTTANVDIMNVRVEPIDEGIFTVSGTGGAAGRITGPIDGISVEHCTLPMSFSNVTGTPGFFTVVSGNGDLKNFKYKNNIGMKFPPPAGPGNAPYYVIDDGIGHKNKAALDFACGANPYEWSHNMFTDVEAPANLPQGNGNKYTSAGTSGGTTLHRADIHFVSDPSVHTYGDWRLQNTSPGHNAADDGRDMGCDNDLVEAYTARALSGAAA